MWSLSHLNLSTRKEVEITCEPETTYMLNDRALWEGLRMVLNGLIPSMGIEHIAKAGFHLSMQEVVVRVFEVQVLAGTQRQRMASWLFLQMTHLHIMSFYKPLRRRPPK